MFYSKTARSQSDTLAPGLTKEAKTWSEEVMSSLLKSGKESDRSNMVTDQWL